MPLLPCLLLLLGAHPAIANPAPGAVRAAYVVGDCPSALALIADTAPDQLGDPLLLVGARCHAAGGDKARALLRTEQVIENEHMASYALLIQAEIHMATPDPGTLPPAESAALAEQVLQALPAGSLPAALEQPLRMLRNRAILAQGRGLEVRDDLRALLQGDQAPEARYWLAWAAEQRGDEAPAITTYRATWIRHAASPWSQRAAERLSAMGQPVPDLGSPEGRSQALQRVQVLRKANHAEAALSLLRQVQAAGGAPPDAGTLAKACFSGRDYPCAVEAYERLGSPAAAGPETLFKHALASYRAGDFQGAVELYTALYLRYPSHAKGDTGSYKIGYSTLDQGLLDEAIAAFEAHLARFPGSRHADEALWFSGWCHYKQGRSEQAVDAWDRLGDEHARSSLAPAAAYWRARAAQDDQQLARLAERSPHTGQAWFALQRLGQLPRVPAVPSPALPALPEAFVAAHPQAADVDALLQVGLIDLAAGALDPLVSLASGQGHDTRIAVARRLVEVGEVPRARKLANTRCADPAADEQLREICLPRPHSAVVNGVLADSGLDPYLPYAIMTAESNMQPEVTSWAGARGLMQLMPEVGERLHAERYPERPYDPALLYRGAYNASLGTAELLELHQRYQQLGHEQTLPLAIAGYNGGAEAVDRWIAAAEPGEPPVLELDSWAEDIGYSETRRYVRKVLGTLMAYHHAYGPPAE